jgi:hypothetical protein
MIKLFKYILVIACVGFFTLANAEVKYKGVIYPNTATNGYFMYYTTAGGLVDSPLSSDGVNVTNSGTLTSGTMTTGSGSITDSSGNITFVNENLVTTGTLGAGASTLGVITESGSAVPNATDGLDFFAATTSAELLGVLSDETGTGVAVFGTAPTFTTKITTPEVENAATITIDSTGAGVNVTTHSDATDDFTVNTTALVVEGDTGNVGIGTASPFAEFYVLDDTAGGTTSIGIDNSDNTNGASHAELFLTTGGANGGDPLIRFNNRVYNYTMGIDNSDGDLFKISYDALIPGINDSFVMDHSGNIGIGTASPDTLLHIESTGTPILKIEGAVDSNPAILIYDGSTVIGELQGQGSGDEFVISGGTGHAIEFRGGNTANSMVIDSTGQVGIGTASPGADLHVYDATAGKIVIQGNDNPWNPSLELWTSGTTNVAGVSATGGTGEVRYNASTGYFPTFYSNGTEKVRILSTGGITFNGDTAAANALDDYEEGTFTPSVTFGGGNSGMTFSTQVGFYTKIGNTVNITLYIDLSAKGSSSGDALVTQLPFTSLSTAARYYSGSVNLNLITFANTFQCLMLSGATNIILREQTEGGSLSALTDADFVNTSSIVITITYQTAS